MTTKLATTTTLPTRRISAAAASSSTPSETTDVIATCQAAGRNNRFLRLEEVSAALQVGSLTLPGCRDAWALLPCRPAKTKAVFRDCSILLNHRGPTNKPKRTGAILLN